MAVEVHCPYCNSKTQTRTSLRITPTATTAQVKCWGCDALMTIGLNVEKIWTVRVEEDLEPKHDEQKNTRQYWPAIVFVLLISIIGLGVATWL